jgi:hypothetical protein
MIETAGAGGAPHAVLHPSPALDGEPLGQYAGIES